ncbi:ATP synthase F0 subunit C [Xylocopilactobacillus apicola]|uniref:ATP synthase F0 subunit C n=1 Tax=Xylocopilactobacillus apicola TaxID=2932184 RepID=UPI0029533CE8|nr:ATP synthase F0 subunit C [Xylocopilactobacillus apicola]
MNLIAAAFAAAFAAIGGAFGDAIVVSKALESMARQPEQSGTIRGTMILGVGLTESTPILAIVIALILVFK